MDSAGGDPPLTGVPDSVWEEPRGPHLPDAITGVPLAVWPFVGLAAAVAWQWFVRLDGSSGRFDPVVLVSSSPIVLAVLIGAALFLRHPDAWWAHRDLAAGAILLAGQGALVLVDPVVRPMIEGLSPDSADAPFRALPVIAYDLLGSLVPTLGFLCVAQGLRTARWWQDPDAGRGTAATAFGIAGVVTIANGLVFGESAIGTFGTPIAIVWIGTVAAGAAGHAFLAVVATRGYRAGEEPSFGWFLAAAAAWGQLGLALSQLALNWLLTLLGPRIDQDLFTVLFRVIGLANATTWLCLLAAFWVGTPADDVDDVDDEPALPG